MRVFVVSGLVFGAAAVALGLNALATPTAPVLQSGVAPLRGNGTITASWATTADSLQGIGRLSDVVVVGRVTQVAPGPVHGDDSRESDAAGIPSQLVTIDVERTLVARGARRNRILITKLGDDRQWIEGDPPYRVGERYILGLDERRDMPGRYRPTGPDARLLIERGQVGTWFAGGVRDELARYPKDEAEQAITRDIEEQS